MPQDFWVWVMTASSLCLCVPPSPTRCLCLRLSVATALQSPVERAPRPCLLSAPAAAVLPARLTSLGHLLVRTGLRGSHSLRTVTTKHGCLSLVWGGLQPSEADWPCPSPPSPSRLQRQLRGTPGPLQSLVASAPTLSLQLWSVSPDHQATAPPAPCCSAVNRVLAHR